MVVTYIKRLGNICWVNETLSSMSYSMFSRVYTPRDVLCTYKNVTFNLRQFLYFARL